MEQANNSALPVRAILSRFFTDRELEGLETDYASSIAIKVCVIFRYEFIANVPMFSLRFELLSSRMILRKNFEKIYEYYF